MAAINVPVTDTFENWRTKTNDISTLVGDGGQLSNAYTANNIIGVLNEIKSTATFDNVITINDQATDGTTELAGNAASMIISTGAQTVLTMNQTGDLSVHADLTTGGVANVGTQLNVTGNTIIGGTTISQQLLTTNGGLDCNGNADVSGTLDVSGATSLADTLAVTGNTTVGGTLTVTGTTTLNSTLDMQNNNINSVGTLGITNANVGTLSVNNNTTLGDATSDNVTFNARVNSALNPDSDNSRTLGTSSLRWSTVHGVTFSGTATTANYADLAELYLSDFAYEAGTVVRVGGEFEVTATDGEHNHSVLGVVSAYPAYLMNNQLENGLPIALKGRVPVKVKGSVNKGDRLVGGPEGHGIADNDSPHGFAIALEDFVAKKSGQGRYGVVEAVVL
ncbi:MAG: hypothetical protein CMB73_03080 [Euryarchaeota archaeon]|nr:hypothetical protein [Euryarchaeota archaeon]|tara:strand:- start:13796 stop:14974 length:1179 start_codon:yes stop_codon:yes gene_type:complete